MENPSGRPIPEIPQVLVGRDEAMVGSAEYEARHDKLTGLLNLRGMSEVLDYFQEHTPGNYAVLSLDLDKLKPTNEAHGYTTGDALLQRTAEVIRSTVRTKQAEDNSPDRRQNEPVFPDIIGLPQVIGSRRGGDEFAVILPGVSDDKTTTLVQERIRRNLKEAGVKASLGGSANDGSPWQETLELADGNMRAEKSYKRRQEEDRQRKAHEKAFRELHPAKRVLSRLGDKLIQFAGIKPPR